MEKVKRASKALKAIALVGILGLAGCGQANSPEERIKTEAVDQIVEVLNGDKGDGYFTEANTKIITDAIEKVKPRDDQAFCADLINTAGEKAGYSQTFFKEKAIKLVKEKKLDKKQAEELLTKQEYTPKTIKAVLEEVFNKK